MENKIYELVIIGGGPAGCSAAVYAARKKIKTLLLLNEWGGQSIVSDDIQNWIGTPHISGNDLKENLKRHVLEYKSDVLEIKENIWVEEILKNENFEIEKIFKVKINSGEIFSTKSILIGTGSQRRKLDILGADIFEHKGLTYCATCDGPLFGGTDVVVIGGGNAAFESSLQLLAYCKSVTQLVRKDTRADEITIQKILTYPNFKLIKNAIPKEILGENFVNKIIYTNTDTNQDISLETAGIFVEIGQIPSTDFVKNICELNESKNIKINPLTQETSQKGIWAAGDCTDVLYHQNNIASGDAVKAIEDIYQFLR